MMTPAEKRFWRLTGRAGPMPDLPGVRGRCWIWVGARDIYKQPMFWNDGRSRYAHQFAWELDNGPKPKGMQLNPACGRALCVRPSHRLLAPRGSHLRRN